LSELRLDLKGKIQNLNQKIHPHNLLLMHPFFSLHYIT
jgi:hypothetical protein